MGVTIRCDNARRIEQMAHRRLAGRRLGGEWFDIPMAEAESVIRDIIAGVSVAPGMPDVELVARAVHLESYGRDIWDTLAMSEAARQTFRSMASVAIATIDAARSHVRAPRGTFDRTAYQRDLMRRRRLESKQKQETPT